MDFLRRLFNLVMKIILYNDAYYHGEKKNDHHLMQTFLFIKFTLLHKSLDSQLQLLIKREIDPDWF